MSLSKAEDSLFSGMSFKNLVQSGVACLKGSEGSRGFLQIRRFFASTGEADCSELLLSWELRRFFAAVTAADCTALPRAALLETRDAFGDDDAARCSALLRSELSDERDPAVVVDSGGCTMPFGSCVVIIVKGPRSSIL